MCGGFFFGGVGVGGGHVFCFFVNREFMHVYFNYIFFKRICTHVYFNFCGCTLTCPCNGDIYFGNDDT